MYFYIIYYHVANIHKHYERTNYSTEKNTLAITLSDKRTQKEYQLQFILSNMTTTRNENAQNICNPKAKDTLLIIYGYRILK